MSTPGAKTPVGVLEQACQDAREILREVIGVGKESIGEPLILESTPLKWFWIDQCDALVFYRARKTGLLISRTHAQGFMIRRCHSVDCRCRKMNLLLMVISKFAAGFEKKGVTFDGAALASSEWRPRRLG